MSSVRVIQRDQLVGSVDGLAAIRAIEEAFVRYSAQEVVSPPVGHLGFANPPADVHIKYGHRVGDDAFVVKVASSFYENPNMGLPSSGGLVLVFNAKTGFPQAVLLDDGWLTDLRTAAAGAVCARLLAPTTISAIGLIGAGTQAHLQLDLLRHVTECRRAVVWGRRREQARKLQVAGFLVETVSSITELAQVCNLIVTTTPSREALLMAEHVRPGTHITAVGADAPGKQELDPVLFEIASVLTVDSRRQCFEFGDSAHAIKRGLVSASRFHELGELIQKPALGRTNDQQITIADLTGLAAQDIEIAKLAFASCRD